MKALSLWQPWASLVIAGIKQWETRSWDTDYRGLLAIHATRTVPSAIRLVIDRGETPVGETLRKLMTEQLGYSSVAFMPMGAILGIVSLKETTPADEVIHTLTWHSRLGDFSPGRFAYRLECPIKFQVPFPAKGKQGLWEWPISAQQLVKFRELLLQMAIRGNNTHSECRS